MIPRTPAPYEAARSEAYEQGLRDAARIFAAVELSCERIMAIAADRAYAGRAYAGGEYAGAEFTQTRRLLTATRSRSAVPARRGHAIEAEAARIAEKRTDRTGSPHEVVELPGGLYGVRKVRVRCGK